MVARGWGWGVRMCEKWGGVGQKVKTFSFKMSSQDLMYNLVMIVNNTLSVLGHPFQQVYHSQATCKYKGNQYY